MAAIAVLFQAVPRIVYGVPVFNLDEVGELLLALTFMGFAAERVGDARKSAARQAE